MRYILALIPPNEFVDVYTNASQKLFSSVSEGYLLSDKSSPHITICQFECENEEKPFLIWKKIETLKIAPFSVCFTGVSFLRGIDTQQDFYWAEISVRRDPMILRVHQEVCAIVKAHHLDVLNDSGDLYRPHLTLARIKLPEIIHRWPDEILEKKGLFKLALGQGDVNGQYLHTIFESDG